jgi:hypothetical protein
MGNSIGSLMRDTKPEHSVRSLYLGSELWCGCADFLKLSELSNKIISDSP